MGTMDYTLIINGVRMGYEQGVNCVVMQCMNSLYSEIRLQRTHRDQGNNYVPLFLITRVPYKRIAN